LTISIKDKICISYDPVIQQKYIFSSRELRKMFIGAILMQTPENKLRKKLQKELRSHYGMYI
jgi:hypothetical protein